MQNIYLRDIAQHVGETVTVRGWVYNKRSSGKIDFLIIRDGTGLVQATVFKPQLTEEIIEASASLTQESSLIVTGTVKEDKRATGGYEIGVENIEIIQIADEYPISKKEHGIDFLLNNRHLWFRSSRQFAIMRVRNEVVKAIRDYFYENHFTLIDSPILTGAIGEASNSLFETDYFDLGKAYLAQTGQLYLEAACMAFNRVCCFGPTFRAEKSKTRRHLTEFWMVEGEMAFCESSENMDIQEGLVRFILTRVLEKCQAELATLERDISLLEQANQPFYRISYDEAVERLQKAGSNIEWGRDFGGEDETILTQQFDRPVFVYNYPNEVKAFYMKENPDNPKTVLCDDLLAPEGYGEIIGASQREDQLEKLLARIEEENLPADAYDWYLDLRKYGSVPHSGFGMGIERTVGWICGIQHIREAIPFPRTLARIHP